MMWVAWIAVLGCIASTGVLAAETKTALAVEITPTTFSFLDGRVRLDTMPSPATALTVAKVALDKTSFGFRITDIKTGKFAICSVSVQTRNDRYTNDEFEGGLIRDLFRYAGQPTYEGVFATMYGVSQYDLRHFQIDRADGVFIANLQVNDSDKAFEAASGDDPDVPMKTNPPPVIVRAVQMAFYNFGDHVLTLDKQCLSHDMGPDGRQFIETLNFTVSKSSIRPSR